MKEHEDHKQAKTTTPLVPLYDWNDDNDEITPVETKEEENPETETTEESAAETEEKTTTEDPQIVKFYPWESPVCKDKSDACESFKHMCSLFRYRKIFCFFFPSYYFTIFLFPFLPKLPAMISRVTSWQCTSRLKVIRNRLFLPPLQSETREIWNF